MAEKRPYPTRPVPGQNWIDRRFNHSLPGTVTSAKPDHLYGAFRNSCSGIRASRRIDLGGRTDGSNKAGFANSGEVQTAARTRTTSKLERSSIGGFAPYPSLPSVSLGLGARSTERWRISPLRKMVSFTSVPASVPPISRVNSLGVSTSTPSTARITSRG